jgi:hypothetical protein
VSETAAPRSRDFLDARLKPVCDAYLQAAQVPGASIAIVAGDRGHGLQHRLVLEGVRFESRAPV